MPILISKFEENNIPAGLSPRGLLKLIEKWKEEKKYGLSIPVIVPENISLPPEPARTAYMQFGGAGEVSLEEEFGANGTVVVDIAQKAEISFVFNPKVSREVLIKIGEGARVSWKTNYSDVSTFVNLKAELYGDAKFDYVSVSSDGFVKEEINVFLKGIRSETKAVSIMNTAGNVVSDITQNIFHESDETRSEIFTRGIARDSSKIIYRAGADLPKGLNNISGHEDARFLALSVGAEIDAIPILLVATPHVSSSHALSISSIRPEDLFYAESRGLTEDESRSFITEGFLNV